MEGWQRGAPRRVIVVTLAAMLLSFCLGYLLACFLFPHIFGSTKGQGLLYSGFLGAAVCLGTVIGLRLRQQDL